MKGRTLILIFLFLCVLIFSIPSVCADTKYDYFNFSGSTQVEYETPDILYSQAEWIDSVYFPQFSNMKDFKHLQMEIPASQFSGTKDSEYDTSVTFTVDGDVVGNGIFGYHRTTDDTTIYIHVWCWPSTWDIQGKSGAKRMMMTGNSLNIGQRVGNNAYGTTVMPTGATHGHFMYSGGRVQSDYSTYSYEYSIYSQYEQSYPFDYTDEQVFNIMNLFRSSALKAKCNIEIGGVEVLDDTAYQSTPLDWTSTDKANNTWVVTLTNEYSDIITKTITFGELETDGIINFNQSSYVDPENIEVDWDINGYNSDYFNYEIQIVTSISGDPSQDSWAADGNWNTSPFISSASGAAVFDFYSDGYDLPIWIMTELWAQDKTTGTWTKLDSTPVVIYHETVPEAGMVWTDKESYNVTEIVTIYTDTADGGYLMIDKRNDPLYDSYNIYSGLSHVKFSLQSSHVGTWDVYLYENSIMTNSTVFTVLADNDTAYFSWWGDVQKGEAAYYDYVATSSNSVISIYDGVGEKQYSFNATAGYNEGQISTMPGAAGNWTGSLYDGGVYYNSSLEVYASESWIRFVDDSYYLGDTIEIEYFIIDPGCKIRLKDGLCQYGGRSTILTWMPGSFHTGQRGTLEFTLSDDNEFGLQVETNLESGYYLPGEWRVEALFETETGYAFVDDTTYVHDAAKEDEDDPAAVSNEMIGIFFSPQGIFLMFTVIITVMGLAVTKQPAGGAVCAVVGVGFGRFFNVLPTWMLLLTVIALVAFAGVSTAIYIKGK